MSRIGRSSGSDSPGQTTHLLILDGLTRTGLFFSCLSLFLLLTAYIYEVCARYFFNVPTSWSYDFSTWCLAICIMLALPEVTRSQANITIDFILEYLSPGFTPDGPANHLLRRFYVLSDRRPGFADRRPGVSSRITSKPTGPIPYPNGGVSLVIPIGFVLCAFQFLRLGLSSKSDKTTDRE